MSYLIILAVLLGLVLLAIQWKRYILRRNFDRYVDMHVSIMLAKERVGRHRVYGSLILELKDYHPALRSIYVSRLKSRNKDVRIKYFNALLFEVNLSGKNDINLLSIGVRLSAYAERACKENKEWIYVGGKLYFEGKKAVPFGKHLPVRAIR